MSEKEEAYICTTETLYPNDTEFESVIVRLYGRNRDQEAITVTVTGFEPYFLAEKSKTDEVSPAKHQDLIGYEDVDTDPLSERFDHNPTELVKVIAKYPHSVRDLRDRFDRTWGADTIFTERFRIDHGIRTGVRVPTDQRRDNHIIVEKDDVEPVEIKDVEPRVLTLDIETDDRGAGFPDPGDARILSIAAYDSYDDEYTVFLDLAGDDLIEFFDVDNFLQTPGGSLKEGVTLDDLGMTEPDRLEFADTETGMLTLFANYVKDRDPDLITGWNSGDSSNDGFDLPHIIERMGNVGVTVTRLSREREVEVKEHGDDYKPSITGRALYDLMDGWADTKFTNPRSKKLDYVAAKALDDAKIEHQDQGYYEMYRDGPVKFVNYNVKDTRLTVEINEEEGIIPFKKRLKDIVGVDWSRTHENNEFIEMAVRRKCAELGLAMITAYDNPHVGGDVDEVNYEGAYVFPSFSGLKENIVGIDLESLYPRTQQMLNVSPDCRIEAEGVEWYKLKDELNGQYVTAENGQKFRTDHDGIVREIVDDYMELKAKFKNERNEAAPGSDEHEKLAESYNVTKTIVNSIYGFSGWNRSPLYNPHDAAAVTLTGQAVIKRTAKYIDEETEGSVSYGDTDSVYCKWPDTWGQVKTLETVEEHCEHLNNNIYPQLCEEYGIDPNNNRWNMELEKLCTMFMSGSKKRYAANSRWREGMSFNEVLVKTNTTSQIMTVEEAEGSNDVEIGHFSVTGFDCVKSNFSLLTKEVQEEVLEKIVREADDSEIVETVHQAAASIDAKDPDWDYIGIPQGIGQRIDPENPGEENTYLWSLRGDHPKGEAPRAAWFANHLLDVELAQGDKPKRAVLKPTHTVNGDEVDVIAYDSSRDLDGVNLTIDPIEMQRKCLENPLEDILESIGIELGAAMQGKVQSQESLGAFM